MTRARTVGDAEPEMKHAREVLAVTRQHRFNVKWLTVRPNHLRGGCRGVRPPPHRPQDRAFRLRQLRVGFCILLLSAQRAGLAAAHRAARCSQMSRPLVAAPPTRCVPNICDTSSAVPASTVYASTLAREPKSALILVHKTAPIATGRRITFRRTR